MNLSLHNVTNNVYEDGSMIYSKGNVINYVIPSFPVYCAKLAEVKVA